MYIELACLDKVMDKEQTREFVFSAADLYLNGVCILPGYLTENKPYVPNMVLASPVDYPAGTSDIKVRAHATLAAIRHGANCIDLVMNHTLVINKQIDKLLQDIEGCLSICRTHDVQLRVMMEYRIYEQASLFYETIELLDKLGVEYVFPATGFRVDNFHDNIIAARSIMQKSKLKVITNGNILTKEQYEIAKKADIYGVRLSSIPLAKELFGV